MARRSFLDDNPDPDRDLAADANALESENVGAIDPAHREEGPSVDPASSEHEMAHAEGTPHQHAEGESDEEGNPVHPEALRMRAPENVGVAPDPFDADEDRAEPEDTVEV